MRTEGVVLQVLQCAARVGLAVHAGRDFTVLCLPYSVFRGRFAVLTLTSTIAAIPKHSRISHGRSLWPSIKRTVSSTWSKLAVAVASIDWFANAIANVAYEARKINAAATKVRGRRLLIIMAFLYCRRTCASKSFRADAADH